MFHEISPEPLSLDTIEHLISKRIPLKLSEESISRIIRCREYLDRRMIQQKDPIYGITTGFGSLCNISINHNELSQLQHNLVVSHACGTGDKIPERIVKIIVLLKIHALSLGYSAVQLATIERLMDMYNSDILPVIYEQGSLGASGDLSPLAHMSLPLLGLGEVYHDHQCKPSAEVLQIMGWKPITLQSKEGLALLNGTQFMSGYGVYCLLMARRLSLQADTIAAISLDAFDGRIEPFAECVHKLRPHQGQLETAQRMRELLKNSELIGRHKHHVQDAYSFRCVPQVHGASKDTIRYAQSVIETEINSVTDNPTVIPEEDTIISAGNFHGQPLALVLDFMAIAVAELASISGQRTYQLIGGKRELPQFLVANPGLNSGFMIPQYTAASIISQNKQLATPASVDSIESSGGQEDHVSMGANAATKLRRVLLNTERVLAIELFNAAQALDFRRPLRSSPKLEELVEEYRRVVPFIENDSVMYPHIEASINFLRNSSEFL